MSNEVVITLVIACVAFAVQWGSLTRQMIQINKSVDQLLKLPGRLSKLERDLAYIRGKLNLDGPEHKSGDHEGEPIEVHRS